MEPKPLTNTNCPVCNRDIRGKHVFTSGEYAFCSIFCAAEFVSRVQDYAARLEAEQREKNKRN